MFLKDKYSNMRYTVQIIPKMVCVFLLLPLMSVPAASAVEILTKKNLHLTAQSLMMGSN
jgi:hypothetical protein